MTTATITDTVFRTPEDQEFAAQWRSWHQRRLEDLSAPYGFMAVTALHWITRDAKAFAGLPGQWWEHDDWLYVELNGVETLVFNGAAITGVHKLGSIAEGDSFTLGLGEIIIEAAKRGGKYILRPRHPQNPLLQSFTDVPTFEPDIGWVIEGTFTRFLEPRETTVGAVIKGLKHVYRAPGKVTFELYGRTHTLTAFNGFTESSLTILFTDATSGKTTYAANRSLHIDAPDPDGKVSLDFNRAVNLPCAFTDLATCPLPPARNRLSVAITAGEKIPHERS
ncbi:hypothetical protein CQ018_05850 [Arthrobacter sp. MYb227]|uniref:DUF1684 domain-containing protein n=1 Tax=Arthrobacter sp. MYb227 TaxID=1848601 RepID=UPI000CFB4FD3|nr:DUF1684 domain-containing protein [Arthrobacter sp. MYb227]PQZ94863.1 hypothetical protein CQ018_05850 [Arthrobacter sp. MYb227]